MTEQKQTAEGEYKNRKIGLVIFGVIHVMVGGLCLLSLPMMLMGMIAGAAMEDAQMSVKMIIPGFLFYLFAAIWFIWVGIGSVMAKKWARALILVASWLTLIGGCCGLVFWLFFSPDFYNNLPSAGEVPQAAMTIVRYITTFFLTIVYVVGPGAFVLFYRSRHVKDTCEALDNKPRWTDRCPLPVLAISLLFAVWSVSLLSMAAYNFAMPFFGVIVSGVKGAAVCLLLIAAGCWTSWGAYKLKSSAWWSGVLIIVTFLISAAVTFSRHSLIDYYEVMDFPEEQLVMLRQIDISGWMMNGPMIGSCIALLGYMIYTKRFFRLKKIS